MVTNSLKLFIKKGCRRCEILENYLIQKKINFEKINIENLEGFMLAQLHEVMILPTLIMFDSNGNAINRFNIPSEINEIITV